MTSGSLAVWVMIPARGGSKGIRGKNLRSLAGRPLIRHVLDELGRVIDRDHVIVSTDDSVISHAVAPYAVIHQRPTALADDRSTLDDVAVSVADWLLSRGASPGDVLVTVQPTSPFIKSSSVDEAVARLAAGAGSVISVVDDRRLRWSLDSSGRPHELFESRVNRQWLPPSFSETGGIIAARLGDIMTHGSRVVAPISLLELDDIQGLDIDTYGDWAVAEYQASRRRIVIRADAGLDLGMGHVYRAYALFLELHQHEVQIVVSDDVSHRLGAEFLLSHDIEPITVADEQGFLDTLRKLRPDIVIIDRLDTDRAYMARVRDLSPFLVSFEDLGDGGLLADVVVNDLYTDLYAAANHWYGVRYAILGPQFECVGPAPAMRPEVKHILVSFGGADPSGLTTKALAGIRQSGFSGEVTVVLGPGYSHGDISLDAYSLHGRVLRAVTDLAVIMRDCDLALTSAGRTVTELMTQGIPTIALCQNLRELLHTHASSPFGVTNLGLGEHVTPEALARHLDVLLGDRRLRASMRERMLAAVRERSNSRIVADLLAVAQAARVGEVDKGDCS